MDYSFAPGKYKPKSKEMVVTWFDRLCRRMFRRRANTVPVPTRKRSTVRQFIQYVSNNNDYEKPINDMLVGSHAHIAGVLFVPMFPGQKGLTQYETLEKTMETDSATGTKPRSIEIPDATIGHNPGGPITHSFHIKGCNIGRAEPFLVKLKAALGDKVKVTAPKYYYYLIPDKRRGIFETMGYYFTINRKSTFKNRAGVLKAFQDHPKFKRYDNSEISDADWDNWLPGRKIESILKPKKKRLKRKKVYTANLGPNTVGRRTLPWNFQFICERTHYCFSIDYERPGDVPAHRDKDKEKDMQEQALKQSLDDYNKDHPFPIYRRFGYDNGEQFFEGYTWRFKENRKKLICTGTRYEYTLKVPILDVNTGYILFNFYPNEPPDNPFPEGLPVGDDKFVKTV